MFGEALDPRILDRAVSEAQQADAFVAVGSSLQVQLAASLVDLARQSGARVIIVTAEPTPYDAMAERVVRTPIVEAVPALLDELDQMG